MLDQDEINKLMAQANDIDEETTANEETSDDTSTQEVEQEEISTSETTQESSEQLSDEDISELIDNIEESSEDDKLDIDDIEKLAEGETCEIGSKQWVAKKIKDSHLPYPVEPEHKVVDQLSQVTQDGEEKAGEVFDAILESTDKLAHIDSVLGNLATKAQEMEQFVLALEKKFPNIEMFAQKAQDMQDIKRSLDELNADSSEATTALYKAMETMQYQDISRQKIERVITVVRKLSEYLNHVFDNDSGKPDVKVAKHIHGDEVERDVLASEEDIDKLISEFGIEQ